MVFNQAWQGYAATGMYRGVGPSIATKLGAAAVLVKSLASFSLKSPHTGGTSYLETIPTVRTGGGVASSHALRP